MDQEDKKRVARRSAAMVLGVWGTPLTRRAGRWYVNHSFGRIVERLATKVLAIRYHGPLAPASVAEGCDYPLVPSNIEVAPTSVQRNSLQAVKRPDRLLRHYWKMTRHCDALFLRGSQPLLWTAHWMARCCGRPVVHWIVGNPVAIMAGAERGYGRLLSSLGIQFARCERSMTRLAAGASGADILTNGAELARIYRSHRTRAIVSTTITDEDFRVRDDTCRSDPIRLLFVGFIRPEKGLEYLIRALPGIDTPARLQLGIVGSWGQFTDERDRLQRLAVQLGVDRCISWEGYAPFGAELFDQMDRSDLLVLPSLSEGTPRVLVEARARSLPIVSTAVGGIPSSVTHGQDGLLVPPADPVGLCSAISQVIRDGDLRRRLIRNGRRNVRRLTVECFAEQVVALLSARNPRRPRAPG